MSNWSESVDFCPVLAQAKCHEYALSKIAGVSAADAVWRDAFSVATRSLSLIVNMSRNYSLHAELKRARLIEILTPLAVPTRAAELRVLMAWSYIHRLQREQLGQCDVGLGAVGQQRIHRQNRGPSRKHARSERRTWI